MVFLVGALADWEVAMLPRRAFVAALLYLPFLRKPPSTAESPTPAPATSTPQTPAKHRRSYGGHCVYTFDYPQYGYPQNRNAMRFVPETPADQPFAFGDAIVIAAGLSLKAATRRAQQINREQMALPIEQRTVWAFVLSALRPQPLDEVKGGAA
jgi:hypothetical protein